MLTRSCACIMLTCELQEALIGDASCESHVCCVIIDALECSCMGALCMAREVEHLAIMLMLVVVWTDELADVLPDFSGRRPSRCRVRCVPHHARITRHLLILRTELLIESCRTNTVRNALVSATRAVSSRRSRPLALTSYLYCFILNHAQLGRDLHHIHWNRFTSVRALAHLIVNNYP